MVKYSSKVCFTTHSYCGQKLKQITFLILAKRGHGFFQEVFVLHGDAAYLNRKFSQPEWYSCQMLQVPMLIIVDEHF